MAQVGQPLGVIRGEGWVRCGVSPDDVIPGIEPAQRPAPGKPKGALYIDDGTNCSARSRHAVRRSRHQRIIGDPNPKWTGNAHTTFRYKKLELSGLVDIQHGGDVERHARRALELRHAHGHGDPRDLHRPDATPTARAICTRSAMPNWYPGPVAGPGAGLKIPIGENWYRTSGLAACPFTGIDEPCLEDGGYVKLRELSVAYTLRQPWVGRSLG